MENDGIKYDRVVAYIRKSSEDNEKGEAHKQLNSIEYQRQFVKDAQTKYNLKPILRIFEDDKTGYEAYVRDGFEAMLNYIEDHREEVDGIVCTEISRLARNFGDGGKILWFLQNGTIKRIYTLSKEFTNSSSDQLMVAIEFAMSKKSSDETGERTKQGMRSKARTMKHPSRRPILGYKTEGPVGQKRWVVDPESGPLVRSVFEQFATGNFTFKEITEFAYNIGLRSTFRKSTSSKLTQTSWYKRLNDIQYTGIFFHEGERIAGEYEPLISSELFYRAKEVITNHQHPKEAHLEYSYSGIVKCGICGGNLSGTHKKGITYYRCSKRNSPCKDTARITYVPEKKLEEKLMETLSTIEIDQETWKACREYVTELSQPERIKIKKQIRELEDKVSAEVSFRNKLGRKYAEDKINKSDYDRLLEDSDKKLLSLKNTIIKCENIAHELDELMSGFIDNIKHITSRLRSALPHNKRELVDIFCENLVWKDGKLVWDWKKPYFVLVNQPKSFNMLPRVDSDHELTA